MVLIGFGISIYRHIKLQVLTLLVQQVRQLLSVQVTVRLQLLILVGQLHTVLVDLLVIAPRLLTRQATQLLSQLQNLLRQLLLQLTAQLDLRRLVLTQVTTQFSVQVLVQTLSLTRLS